MFNVILVLVAPTSVKISESLIMVNMLCQVCRTLWPSIKDVGSLEGGRGVPIDDMGRYDGGRGTKNPI